VASVAVGSPAVSLAEFDYDLPPDRIAQSPVEPRDAARLLVDRGDDPPTHHRVRDLPDLLHPGDLVVVNDTRVIPARLLLSRSSGGAAEVLLLEPLDESQRVWEALVRPGRRLRHGEHLLTATGEPLVEVGPSRSDGTRAVRLLGDRDVLDTLEAHGQVPLPPYITTPLRDAGRYQTVFADRPASVAAPTAGLHLTTATFDALAERRIGVARVELVVGLDTFRPITVDDPGDHRMHTERYTVPAATMAACEAARAAGARVVAIGTTSVRALESAAARGQLTGRTDLFIRRPYPWQVVDVLLTNFHLPRTTLLLMIDAFVGPRWRALYEIALAEGYRFLSFGDAMLLRRDAPAERPTVQG
jgi:S-adenosylmethionine:tRNA ribosyltransferase-isomerase